MKNYFTKQDEKLKWNEGKSEVVLKTAVCNVTKRHNTSYTGIEGDYVVLDAPDWVIIIPETDKKFLMVKQFRHGENGLSIEFPGGVVDKGESPETAAGRELKEETGYKAGKLIKLGSCNPNPAIFSNHVHFYLAEELVKDGKQNLDDDELINCIEMTKMEVLEGMGTPQFPHALMGTAMSMYFTHRKECILF